MIANAFIDAVDLGVDVADVYAFAVIHHTLEQLSVIMHKIQRLSFICDIMFCKLQYKHQM